MLRVLLLAAAAAVALLAQESLEVSIPNPGGQPVREVQPDGRIAVRASWSSPVLGDVSGSFSERSMQLFDASAERASVAASAFFKLETATGSIEGYYSGLVDRSTGEAVLTGSVITATRAFSDWMPAWVTYRTFLTEEGALRAALTITTSPVPGDWLIQDVGPSSPALAGLRDVVPDDDGVTFTFTGRGAAGPGVYRTSIESQPSPDTAARACPPDTRAAACGRSDAVDTSSGADSRSRSSQASPGAYPSEARASSRAVVDPRSPSTQPSLNAASRAAIDGMPNVVVAGAPFVDPRGLAISPVGGMLYIADPRAGEEGRGRVFAYDPAADVLDELPQTLATAPQSIAVVRADARDVLYYTGRDFSDGSPAILRATVDDSRPPVAVWKGDPLISPDGLAIARNGDLYVADRAGAIYRISGHEIIRIAAKLTLGNPAGLALTRDERLLLVPAVQDGRAGLLLIDTRTLAAGFAVKGLETFDAMGGLQRAAFNDVFGLVGFTGSQGKVYHVPVGSLPKP